jgi:hypothetical protein
VPRPRRDLLPLAAILALAAALRLWRLGHGLPDFVEEAIPLRRALEMGGWQAAPDLNPRFFNYPSLVIYLQLLLVRIQIALGQSTGALASPADFWVLFQTDPSRPVMLARAIGMAADLAAVAGAWRLARRLRPGAGAVAALAVAASAVMIHTSRLVQVDPFLAAAVVWAVERLVAWQQDGGRRRLAEAVVLIGLAAGAKYQGGLLVAPLAWALWAREGRRGLRRWPLLAFASLAVFVVTTPYAVLDFADFRTGLGFESRHMASGHLGSQDATGLAFAVATLARDLGPIALLGLAGLVWPWLRRRPGDDRRPQITVVLAWVFLAAPVATARMEAERYLVPLIPLLAAVAAVTTGALGARLGRRRWAPAALAAVVLAPLVVQGARAANTGRGHTQIQARRWVEENLDPARSLVVLEPYAARLRNPFDDAGLENHPAWARASEASRRQYLAGPRYLAVDLPLLVSGEVTVTAGDGSARAPQTIVVFAHASDANAIFYEPALLAGATHVVVSSGVSRRHQDDPARYPRQVALYRLLQTRADRLADFRPGHGVDGPEITIYGLGARFQNEVASSHPLDPFWWTRDVPPSFRARFEEVAVPPERRCGSAPVCPDGRIAPWVRGLGPTFGKVVAPFLGRLAVGGVDLRRWAAVRQLAAPLVVMTPEDLRATDLYVQACVSLGDLRGAEQALRRSLRAGDPKNGNTLRLALAEILAAAKRPAEAETLAREVLVATSAGDSLHARAVALLGNARGE